MRIKITNTSIEVSFLWMAHFVMVIVWCDLISEKNDVLELLASCIVHVTGPLLYSKQRK